jgi:superfamily II RNA helicase
MIDSFVQQLSFELDPFQKQAMEMIDQGHSVVVCAPTGSGKTIIAEFAATKALEEGKRLFYTTPLKALSNQKFFDLKERYGEPNVGLLTGDLSINRDARIVVMTTEVFRNMLYGVHEDTSALDRVGYVVLDEVHFMNDAERGTVWEECIIYCPETIQMIGLSATIANAAELTQWIGKIHHDTHLIESDFRPVPLRFSYYNREKIQPLFENDGKKLNAQLKTEVKGNRMAKSNRAFRPNRLIQEMHEKEMLPAIFFTFSRKGCDQALKDTKELKLLTPDERAQIAQKIEEFLQSQPFLEGNPMLDAIANGFASHHAGLLPGLKLLVESLFQQGLIKAVFATETLAAGINMPARSTVITSISKRTNDGHRLLTGSEFMQMSGRAGRRGMDSVGYVVIVSSPYKSAKEAASLALCPAEPLNSQFTPTYGMVLNLLQKFTLSEAEFLLNKSFGQFTAQRRLAPLEKEIAQKTLELQHYIEFECPVALPDEDFNQFLKNRAQAQKLKEFIPQLKRQLKKYGESTDIQTELTRVSEHRDSLLEAIQASPCQTCKLVTEHQRNEDKIRQLQKYLKSLNTVYQNESERYWRSFLGIYQLLKMHGQLDPETDKPTPHGMFTAQLRTENELFVSEIIRRGLWENVAPEHLAASISSLVTDSTRDPGTQMLTPSPQVTELLMKIHQVQKEVDQWQQRYHVEAPLTLNLATAAPVEAWCQGLTWERLMASTKFDEGDLVRILRRTSDVLRQLSRIAEVPVELSVTARAALKQLYRDPIKEAEWMEEALEDTRADLERVFQQEG